MSPLVQSESVTQTYPVVLHVFGGVTRDSPGKRTVGGCGAIVVAYRTVAVGAIGHTDCAVTAAVSIGIATLRDTRAYARAHSNEISFVHVVHDAEVVWLIVRFLRSQDAMKGLMANSALPVAKVGAAVV